MKKYFAMVLCFMLAFSIGALAERGGGSASGGFGGPGGGFGGMGGPGAMGGGMTQNDEAIQAVLDANASKFRQFTFTDEQTGIALEYSLYVPEDYDASQSYPLIMFIPDSTGAGKSAAQIVEQYYGATVWVTDEEQAKHASFVLVPAFTGTVTNDNGEADPQVDATVKLIESLAGEYAIDADRLYTTGQSMGCMASLYLNSQYPDLFAASLYVSGQWDISVLSGMESQKFFYVTAGGDEKASGGQDEVMAMFDADNVAYSYGSWSAQDSAQAQDAAVAELLSEGLGANMIRFETGTVFKEGETGMEHMASFNYAYKLTAVRDWLFEQSK
ncbi:MAG: pyrroline-5-carboxylate reductase [Clostridia bacterium]|nr:pyrroline-5-carboxylate reductase [Clostridia bacterium]